MSGLVAPLGGLVALCACFEGRFLAAVWVAFVDGTCGGAAGITMLARF